MLMIQPASFFQSLSDVERLARGSKLSRLLHNPYKYVLAQTYSKLLHKPFGSTRRISTRTFWGEPFSVNLPAGTDIFLTGGKSDDSELRLARYMLSVLKPGGVFLDVGSHFGYYARLALCCVGAQGKVLAVEPSKKSFEVLQANLQGIANACPLNVLAGEQDRFKDFYEFRGAYSEYSTVHPAQFQGQKWYSQAQAHSYPVECLTIDTLVTTQGISPSFIKIDTEGAELEVLQGATKTLVLHRETVIAMEYLAPRRCNQGHVRAIQFMRQRGFAPFVITPGGTLHKCPDLDKHLLEHNLESDNIIFRYCC